MKIDLIKYLTDKVEKEKKEIKEPGPVITISRDYGCPGKKVAEKLVEEINKKMIVKGKDIRWRYVTKEILAEAAKELEMEPEKLEYVFDYETKSILDDIIASHTYKYYKSDKKIRNTIKKVIRNIATEGNVVIVGRGGVAITRDIAKSLHIKLEAPLEWRVIRVAEKHNISFEDARERVLEIDKKRAEFRELFEGKDTDYTTFDITFNCMTLSIEEIALIIVKAAEIRKLL